MKLRAHLMLLVLAALVPVLLFAGTMVGLFATEQRRQTEQGLQETTRALAMAADRELASAVATLVALATSHHLKTGALDAFRAHALRVAATQPDWAGIALFDAAGRLVLTTTPPADTTGSIADQPYFQRVMATARSAVSGYLPGRPAGEPMFAVAVPAAVVGRRHVLSAAVTPRALSSLLAGQRLSPEWVGAVVDADGVVLARTRAADRFVGRPATPRYIAQARDRQEDVFRADTLEGIEAYASFSRVRASGWTVAVGVPAALVDGAVRRSVVTVVGGGLLLLAFGLGIAIVFGRRIALQLGALASSAPALARGEPLTGVDGVVTEVKELAFALEAAIAERRAVERALAASEQRLRRIVEGHVMGVAFTDAGARVRDANDAFLALTGYQRGDVAAGRVSWHDMTPAEYAEADARAMDEMRREGCCRPYEKEVLRQDGSRVPVMVSATLVEPAGADVVVFVHDLTELHWAQHERERLFALLTALLESAPVGYAVLDRELRFVVVNDVLAAVNGVPAARHVGRSVRDVLPELADALEPLHRQVLRTGLPVLNVESVTAHSAWWRGRHHLRSYYPIRDRSGAMLGVGVAVVDITERKRAEQRLGAQHAVTRILADGESLEEAAPRLIEALCGALECDVGEIWHVDRESNEARCIEALATSPEAEGFAAAARGLVLEVGAGLVGRAWRDGKCVWVLDIASDTAFGRAAAARGAGLCSAVALPLMHGEVVGIASFFCRRVWEPDADVLDMLASVGSQVGQFVERRRAERERAQLLALTAQALRDAEASERRYRQLVEALPHVAWTAGPAGALEYLNRHWFDYTGLTPEQSAGEGWRSAVHPDDVEPVLERWQQALAAGEGYDFEHRLRRRDGFYRWFLGRVAPVRDPSGAVVMWLGVAVDIDAQKRAELGALDASRAKDNFLATLSHELRTPLSAMHGWLRLVRTGRLDAAGVERALDTIERNVKLQTQIIEDLLDVSRIVAGKLDLHVVPIDLGNLVDEAVDAARPGAEAKGLALEATIDDGARRSAGDPERLQQVLGNLLANAVKFTDAGGRIAVRLERRGARGRISVRDTGKGIAPELLPHVFDRFRQGRPGRQPGLGLGLSIVKQIVELHGGSVYAESEGEGRGAAFVIQLALADD